MFESIRDTFQSLQENLTTTLKGLSVKDQLNKKQALEKSINVNLNAGTEILDRFQTAWSELHEASQENAATADEVDRLICTLQKRAEKQRKDMGFMVSVLASLPNVITSVEHLSEKILVLESMFETVEKKLIELEDTIETREFQNKQLEQRFELALYKEKKLAALESLRIKLAGELAEKMRRHEVRQQKILKECQKASEENFKRDMQIYKETHTLPKIEFAKPKDPTNEEKENTLEDIALDDNPADLEKFFDDLEDADEDAKED